MAASSQEAPVSWEEWIQKFQLIVIAKEEIDNEDLLQDYVLPHNPYPTLEEPIGTEDQQARAQREARNTAAITAWRDKEHRRAEGERKTFKGSTRGDTDKRFEWNFFFIGEIRTEIFESVTSVPNHCRQDFQLIVEPINRHLLNLLRKTKR